jgi:hypothetical protein
MAYSIVRAGICEWDMWVGLCCFLYACITEAVDYSRSISHGCVRITFLSELDLPLTLLDSLTPGNVCLEVFGRILKCYFGTC